MQTIKYDGFTLRLGDPEVILRGKPYSDVKWGPYQFPILSRSRDGYIRYTCNGPGSADDFDGYEDENRPYGRVSKDGGATWKELTAKDEPLGVPMGDGHCFLPPQAKNGYKAEWLSKYQPDKPGDFYSIYDADRIPEYDRSPVAYDYDSKTGKTTEFKMRINWPHLSMNVYYPGTAREMIYPIETLMGMMGHYTPDGKGGLYFATYQNGFSAVTGELAYFYTVKVFKSVDSGRTWQLLSEFLSDPSMRTADNLKAFEGLCEPFIEIMPDGSMLILMRTGSGCQSFYARSTDGGKTWTKPLVFDKVGVLPQLLTLKCGVTLASYGRPGVFLRATDDPSGIEWQTPIDLCVKSSCCYTSMIALDDRTALLAYSDFDYPDADGVPKKTLMLRKISIEN